MVPLPRTHNIFSDIALICPHTYLHHSQPVILCARAMVVPAISHMAWGNACCLEGACSVKVSNSGTKCVLAKASSRQASQCTQHLEAQAGRLSCQCQKKTLSQKAGGRGEQQIDHLNPWTLKKLRCRAEEMAVPFPHTDSCVSSEMNFCVFKKEVRTSVSNVCQNIFVSLESVENESLEMTKLSALSFSLVVHAECSTLTNFYTHMGGRKRLFTELYTDRDLHHSSQDFTCDPSSEMATAGLG